MGHDRPHDTDHGTLARPGRRRDRHGQLPGRRRPRDPHRPAPQPAHRHPGRSRRRPRAHRGHVRRAGRSGPAGRRRHRRRPPAAAAPRRSPATPPPPSSPASSAPPPPSGRSRVLRAGAWAARGLRVPARNALLADIVPASVYGRAYGFERAMDNLGAIVGPLLALALVGLVGVRTAIALSIIPGLLAALAIVYAIRHAPRAEQRERQPLRLRIRPVLTGRLGRLMVGVSAFEFGNVAATLLILRASELLAPGRDQDRATQLALGLYVAYNLAATVASVPAGRLGRPPRRRPGPGPRRRAVRAGLCRLRRRRHQRPGPGALVRGRRGRHRLCRDGRARRRRRPGPGRAARVGVRAAGGGAELRQPGRQRHRRPALDR